MIDEDVVARNLARQAEWYGEPLRDRFRRLLDRLDVPQAGLAEVLGLSAPMLSQLMSGRRAKISNPAVLARLLAVEALVAEPGYPALSEGERHERLADIRDEVTATTGGTPVNGGTDPIVRPADPVVTLQSLLRAVASAAEIEAAAVLLDAEHSELATLLRTYGNGRTAQARAHLARVLDTGR